MCEALKNIIKNIEYTRDHVWLHSSINGANSLKMDFSTLDKSEMCFTLSEYLYEHYYAFDPNLFETARNDIMVLTGKRLLDPKFVEDLRNANPGSGYKSMQWKITEKTENGDLFVQKDGVTLFIKNNKNISNDTNLIGDEIPVLFPKESVSSMPGFYLAYSNKGREDSRFCTRLYLNLKPTFAVIVIQKLLQALLEMDLSYTLKIINNPQSFSRRDNTVLYISRKDYDKVAPCLSKIYLNNLNGFREDTPGLTLPLARGIAVADNPIIKNQCNNFGSIMSFGQHRMGLVAKGILDELANKKHSNTSIFSSICKSFRDSGINPYKPHLNSPTSPEYNILKL